MNRWLLPEGIEEVLADRARSLESMRRQFLDLFDTWGYDLIIPPVIEFTDSLLTGMGADLDLKTIKVTDQMSGKTMGIRADISPQAARIDARNGAAKGVNRLCYAGTVVQADLSNPLNSRSPIQLGAELFGVDDTQADVEIILLMLQAISLVTEQQITIDLGHAGICRWLRETCDENGLLSNEIYELIQSKRLIELDAILSDENIDDEMRDKLTALPRLLGGADVLDDAEQVFAGIEPVVSAIGELRMIAERLGVLAPQARLFFDLGEMRGSNYHTGVVFAAFADDNGVAKRVANGGRYNEVGAAFGRSRPATGFSTDLKLLAGLTQVESDERYSVYAPLSSQNGYWEEVSALRADGVRVLVGYDADGVDASAMGCQQELVFINDEWLLRPASNR